MKKFACLVSALSALSALLSCSVLAESGGSMEITAEMKSRAVDAIGEYVFFEDEGAMRLPKSASDFNYAIQRENILRVQGSSYSDWDLKAIDYDCEVLLPSYEVKRCSVEGENWPYL